MREHLPRLHRLAWVVVVLALLEAGWLAFDGAHALWTGDYVTPGSGRHAGQLGPWADLVSAVGIDARSTLMKSVHLILGVVWLGVLLAFVGRATWSRRGMLACAVLSLWYLPFGTLLSMVQIGILSSARLRATPTRRNDAIPG